MARAVRVIFRLLPIFLFALASGCAVFGAGPDVDSFAAAQTGEASWYGPGFAGKPTASGEPFNPRALTAAHKTLKFGTRVRVTNVENGKSVVVRINDRFPGTKGRVIDLSEAAFEQIAPKARGVAKVKVEVLR